MNVTQRKTVYHNDPELGYFEVSELSDGTGFELNSNGVSIDFSHAGYDIINKMVQKLYS